MATYSLSEGKILKSVPIDKKLGIVNFLEIDIASWFGGFGVVKLYKIFQTSNSIDLLLKMADRVPSWSEKDDHKITRIHQIASIISLLNNYGIYLSSSDGIQIGSVDDSTFILELGQAKYNPHPDKFLLDRDFVIEMCEKLTPESQSIIGTHLSGINFNSVSQIIDAPLFSGISSSIKPKKLEPIKITTKVPAAEIRNCIKLITNLMKWNFPALSVSSLMLAVEMFYRYGSLTPLSALTCCIISARIHGWEGVLSPILQEYKNCMGETITEEQILSLQFDIISKLEGKLIINCVYSKHCDNPEYLLELLLKPSYSFYVEEHNSLLNEKLGNFSPILIEEFIN